MVQFRKKLEVKSGEFFSDEKIYPVSKVKKHCLVVSVVVQSHSILVRLVTSLTMRVVRLVPVGWGSGQAGAGQAGARRAVDKKHNVLGFWL